MLTFDTCVRAGGSLDDLTQKNTPDLIEIGENNSYWFYVRRSSRNLEVVDKIDGHLKAKGHIDTLAQEYKLSDQQISAAKAGLTL